MKDPYQIISELSLLQQQAGVDPEIKDLICAYGKLCADKGRDIVFYDESVPLDEITNRYVQWIQDRNPEMDPRLLDFFGRYSRAMGARKLPVMFSVEHMAKRLKLTVSQFTWLCANTGKNYRYFTIPKANNKKREIASPEGKLRYVQGWIAKNILSGRKPHRCATAYRKGYSIMDNARPHVGKKVVVRIDLKDFFPSITHTQVRKEFERFGYPYKVAVALANLCTLNGRLPQGSETSPALSNLIARKLDKRIAGLSKKMGFRYTRYADDLILSSNNPKLPSLIPFLKELIREEGFEVNDDKVLVMRRSRRQEVTGVIVNEKTNRPREEVRMMRAVAHRLETAGPESIHLVGKRGPRVDSDPLNIFRGKASYLRMINDEAGEKLLAAITKQAEWVV